MPTISPVPCQTLVRVFEKDGFTLARTSGDHQIYTKPGIKRPLVIPAYYDAFAKTFTVWLGDPATEHVAEEADDDTVFMKDPSGRIIGFEKLNVALAPGSHGLTVELVNTPAA